MKPLIQSLSILVLSACLSLLQQGCTVKWEVVNTPPNPYPNATRIEQRVKNQVYRITSSFNAGNLGQDMADGLVENDEMVRSLAYQYRAPSQQTQDLNPSQTVYLDSLLKDNSMAIDDAIQRHEQWAQAFQGNWNYDYNTPGDRMLYIAYLHYQIKQQQSAIDAAVQSGSLTPDQAQELRNRTQVIVSVERNDYGQNGRLDLSSDQIQELRQMEDDNNRYLRFRAHRQKGGWVGDKYGRWNDQDQRYKNSRPVQNSIPANPESGTSVTPIHKAEGRPLNSQSPLPGTGAPRVIAAVPTSTPVPAVASVPIVTPAHAPAALPVTTNVPLVRPPQVSKPAPVKYLPLDSLTARVKQQEPLFQKIRQNQGPSGLKFAILNRKRNVYNQTLGRFLKQNSQKGVTRDQMNQLSKILDDLDRGLAAAAPNNN